MNDNASISSAGSSTKRVQTHILRRQTSHTDTSKQRKSAAGGIGSNIQQQPRPNKQGFRMDLITRQFERFFVTGNRRQFDEKYKLLRTLGKGSYSTVKLGLVRATNQYVAIKVIDKRSNKFQQHELERELSILQSIHHTNIIRLYNFFDTGRECYIVMQYASGGEVFDRIITNGAYTEGEARSIVLGLLNAISYLHERSIVHRDIKPENLLYATKSPDSPVLLSDFGFSRYFVNAELMTTSCGTPSYVAPEIVLGRTYNYSVDLWSIGVVTYVLLSGAAPFDNDRADITYNNIIECRYSFPEGDWAGVSILAKDFIRNLLQLRSEKRPTAKQALQHPWFQTNVRDLGNLTHTSQLLAKYTAGRKMRRVMMAIRASRALNHSVSSQSPLGSKSPEPEMGRSIDMDCDSEGLSNASLAVSLGDSSPSIHSASSVYSLSQIGISQDENSELGASGSLETPETKKGDNFPSSERDQHAIPTFSFNDSVTTSDLNSSEETKADVYVHTTEDKTHLTVGNLTDCHYSPNSVVSELSSRSVSPRPGCEVPSSDSDLHRQQESHAGDRAIKSHWTESRDNIPIEKAPADATFQPTIELVE